MHIAARCRVAAPGRLLQCAFALATLLWLGGCASLPAQPPRSETHANLDTTDTRLAQALAPLLAAHPGQSALYPLIEGTDALVARLGLARAAQKTLDVQYYIFRSDGASLSIVRELLAAADRGVRVRVLLDDLNLHGQDDILATLDSHPNVEVRLFNPFAHRSLRMFDALDFSRVNRRMHNKSMTADAQLTIVGGRNIGNEYFGASDDKDFSDLDVLAGGPVVAEVEASFDRYWNSESAYPISALARLPSDADARFAQIRAHIDELQATGRTSPYAQALRTTSLVVAVQQQTLKAYWAPAKVLADEPEKVLLPANDPSTHKIGLLIHELSEARTELKLVSPYFVPGKDGVEWLGAQVARGTKVHVLTNSFAATDVSAVHAGYAARRKSLLRAGVELYELKPSAYAEMERKGRKVVRGSSSASLHAKTYMADRQRLYIGSLNLDPRSARLNTEMGIMVDSAALCALLMQHFSDDLLDTSYRVTLVRDDSGDEHLQWTTRDNGAIKHYDSEPDMGFWARVGQQFLRWLPIEEQL